MAEDHIERIRGAGIGKSAQYRILGYEEPESHEESFPEMDKEGHVIGTVQRSEAHSNPERIHAGVGILIIDPEEQQIYLPKRSTSKDKDPNCLDYSTGEHLSIRAGQLETWSQAAKRGLEEEMGLSPSDYALERIPGHIFDQNDPTQTERRTLYLAKISIDRELIPNLEEIDTSEGGWFPISDLLEVIDNNQSESNKLKGHQIRPMLINDLRRPEIRKALEKLLKLKAV